MSFAVRNLSVLAYANGFTLWHYKPDTDPLPSVAEPGYFDEAIDMLASGDMVLVSARDGGQGHVHGGCRRAGTRGPARLRSGPAPEPGQLDRGARSDLDRVPRQPGLRRLEPTVGPLAREAQAGQSAPGMDRPSTPAGGPSVPPAAAGAGLTGSRFPGRVRPTWRKQSGNRPSLASPPTPSLKNRPVPMTPAIASAFLPVLRRVDPERAHNLALQALRLGLAGRAPAEDDPVLATAVLGRTLRNPIGLAAGFDKDAVAAGGLLRLGFGALELGTSTPRPQVGNPASAPVPAGGRGGDQPHGHEQPRHRCLRGRAWPGCMCRRARCSAPMSASTRTARTPSGTTRRWPRPSRPTPATSR